MGCLSIWMDVHVYANVLIHVYVPVHVYANVLVYVHVRCGEGVLWASSSAYLIFCLRKRSAMASLIKRVRAPLPCCRQKASKRSKRSTSTQTVRRRWRCSKVFSLARGAGGGGAAGLVCRVSCRSGLINSDLALGVDTAQDFVK